MNKCKHCGKATTRPLFCSKSCGTKHWQKQFKKSNIAEASIDSTEGLVNQKEFGAMFFYSDAEIRHLTKMGLPFVKFEGHRYFDVEKCQAWHRGEEVV
jgi:succinate dehydrogenase/fumarate reductase flavoprotein subunit